MLQGSGAMPTLVVEEGLVPFTSGETPHCHSALCPTETLPLFPKTHSILPRWCCRIQWDHLRDPARLSLRPHPQLLAADVPPKAWRCATTSQLWRAPGLGCQGNCTWPGDVESPVSLLPVAL